MIMEIAFEVAPQTFRPHCDRIIQRSLIGLIVSTRKFSIERRQDGVSSSAEISVKSLQAGLPNICGVAAC